MAKQIDNANGFLVIEMTKEEARKIGFGMPRFGCFCMSCNSIIEDNIYYIAILNDTMCKECFDDFIKCISPYIEDLEVEKRNFDRVMNLLK